MPLSTTQRNEIRAHLRKKMQRKIAAYSRETTSMPFLARLIQDNETIAAYSFIHSISTTLGMSIYEDVSVIIAKENSSDCFRNYGVGGVLSQAQKSVIARITNELRNGEREANINQEIEEILSASSENGRFQKDGNIADFYMEREGTEHFSR